MVRLSNKQFANAAVGGDAMNSIEDKLFNQISIEYAELCHAEWQEIKRWMEKNEV